MVFKTNLIKWILAILVTTTLILTASCSVEKRAQRHLAKACSLDPQICATKFKDSLRITDSLRVTDSINRIVIPATNINVNLDNLCDSLGKLRRDINIKSKSGKTTLTIKNNGANGLSIDCNTDSLESVNRMLTRERNSLKESFKEAQSTLIMKEKAKSNTLKNLLIGAVIGLFAGLVITKR